MSTRSKAGGFALIASLLAFAPAVPAQARTLFFEDFDYSGGSLAEGQWTTTPEKSPAIANGQACGDVQSGAVYDTDIDSAHVRVSYSFSAASPDGFETYVVAGTGSQLFIAGCDGGYGEGMCTPTIRRVIKGSGDTVGPSTSGKGVPLTPNTSYRVEVEFNDGLITLAIADGAGQVLATLDASLGETFTQYGVGVGRMTDGLLSCVDDFRIEDLS